MIREIPNARHNAILGSLLKGDPIKAVAIEHAVGPNTVRELASRYSLSPMLVLPAERQQLLRARGKL